ncbi:MAG: HAMP domain-containing histidine kinase [Clostridiales Family XIII bacterium]|jgi:signal transduction histidine kinase|nr:HAMP domain-containing histidine kinase [Clostridiales Family XIII bacterium]
MKTKAGNRFGVKCTLFALCVIFMAGALFGAVRTSNLINNYDFYHAQDGIYVSVNPADALSGKDYQETETFLAGVRNDVAGLLSLIRNSKSAAYIESGATIENYLDAIINEAYNGLASAVRQGQRYYDAFDYRNHLTRFYTEPFESSDAFLVLRSEYDRETGEYRESVFRDYGEAGVREAFAELYAEQIAEVKKNFIADELASYENTLQTLDERGLSYFVTDGTYTITNVSALKEKRRFAESDFSGAAAYYSVQNGEFFKASGTIEGGVYPGLPTAASDSGSFKSSFDGADVSPMNNGELAPVSFFLAYPESYLQRADAKLSQMRAVLLYAGTPSAAAAIIAFVLFILLLVFTGRRRGIISDPENGGPDPRLFKDKNGDFRRLYLWDKCLMEAQALLVFFCLLFGSLALKQYLQVSGDLSYYYSYWPNGTAGAVLFIVVCAALSAGGLWCILSIVRNLKARTFARRSLIGLVLIAIGRGIAVVAGGFKAGFDKRNPLAKTIFLVLALWFVTMLSALVTGLAANYRGAEVLAGGFVLLVILAIALYFSALWARRYAKLRAGIEEVSRGNLNYRIDLPEGSTAEFDVMSRCVNEIGTAIETAVANELKNQHLKTDLISNVSHDLKTPLTSIITYTDLLKKEGLDSPGAAGYLDILEEKGLRLRKLTDDLFEAAKASSGAVPVRKERVDLLSLVRQEIAETGEGFEANGLDVVVDAADEHYYVNADGNLMWRVMENLFNNVRKYAQPNTRVYIDLRYAGTPGFPAAGAYAGRVRLEIKNISAARLNMPADELMERFQRGDESRTTEGSGLGLAIARDLVRLQEGRFEIVIDGDLFKAAVELETYPGV